MQVADVAQGVVAGPRAYVPAVCLPEVVEVTVKKSGGMLEGETVSEFNGRKLKVKNLPAGTYPYPKVGSVVKICPQRLTAEGTTIIKGVVV